MARLGALAAAMALGAGWLGACSAGPSQNIGSGPRLDTRALTTEPVSLDLDDFFPALEATLWKHGLAIERRLTSDEAWRAVMEASLADGPESGGHFVESIGFTLRDIRDRPGEIIARLDEVGNVRIEVRLGRFGDPERERRIAADVVERMGQLAGVDAAVIR